MKNVLFPDGNYTSGLSTTFIFGLLVASDTINTPFLTFLVDNRDNNGLFLK